MSAAQATLGSTTLAQGCSAAATSVLLLSASGLVPGSRLYVDRELMSVTSLGLTTALGQWVNVRRGVDGTTSSEHSATVTVRTGSANEFFQTDPQGAPGDAVLVSPWINVSTGDVWVPQGNDGPTPYRWWARQELVHSVASLGVLSSESDVSDVTQN